MEYFVTGGTGFIGSALVERLVEDDHEVTVLTRDRSNAADLPDAVTVVEGDVREKDTMREAMRGADGLFHLAAWFQIGPGPWNEERAHEINVEGTRAVLELMDELDVPKGVYASTMGVYGNTGGETVDESYRAPNDFPTVYQDTKWRAHYEVADPMIADGLPLVVATLGAVYGPGDKDYGGSVRTGFQGYLTGELPMIPDDFTLPWDHVDDVAANLYRAMTEGDPGEEYIVANEPRNMVDVFDTAAEITGVSPPRSVPGWVFSGLGTVVGAVEGVTRPPEGFESELLSFFASGSVLVDNGKARDELGIEHRPLAAGLYDYLEWELGELDLDHEPTRPDRATPGATD